MLAAHRRHNRLIVDAGVGHQDPERLKCRDRAALEIEHPGLLAQPRGSGKVGAARIRDGWNPHTPLLGRKLGQPFEPFNTGNAEGLGIGHDVGLVYRDEVFRAEIPAHLDLMVDRPLHRRPKLAGVHGRFFLGKPHPTCLQLSMP